MEESQEVGIQKEMKLKTNMEKIKLLLLLIVKKKILVLVLSKEKKREEGC